MIVPSPLKYGARCFTLKVHLTAILEMIADGLPNPKIAETFKISVRTVETHRQRIMDKLCLHNSSLLVRFALSRRQPGKTKAATSTEA